MLLFLVSSLTPAQGGVLGKQMQMERSVSGGHQGAIVGLALEGTEGSRSGWGRPGLGCVGGPPGLSQSPVRASGLDMLAMSHAGKRWPVAVFSYGPAKGHMDYALAALPAATWWVLSI